MRDVRLGVNHADPTLDLDLVFPRSYERNYEPSENIRRAEDCPPYQEGRIGAVHSALDGEASIPFSVADTLLQCARDVPTNGRDAWRSCVRFFTAKARRCIVKVGRAVHCAPVWVVQTRLLSRNPAVRALTGAATSSLKISGGQRTARPTKTVVSAQYILR